MKFLNKIDGASKLKQDSSNRLVTDIEKASWNSKAEGNHNHSKNEITDFPTKLPADGGNADTVDGKHASDFALSSDIKSAILPPRNIVRSNLGNPSITEMALIDAQATNKIWFHQIDKILIEDSVDGINYTIRTDISDTQKQRLVSGNSNASMRITKGNYFRITLSPVGYTYLNYIYMYLSTSGNGARIKCEKKRDDGDWITHFDYTNYASGWPGHMFIPHSTIAFSAQNTAGHFNQVRITIETESATNKSPNMILYGLEWWGGYPAGKRTIYRHDENQNVAFPAELEATTFKNSSGTEVSYSGHTHDERYYTKTQTDTQLNDKVDNSRVLTDVPINAKFTDTNTTYSEITTAEIDAGTASTLRTITGRRVKYILDKVQGWIGGLTKSDVGLSNVDNIQQATKSEFNSHNADSTRHIISSERTKWNTMDNKVDKVIGNVNLLDNQILILDKEVSSVSLWDKTLAPGVKKPVTKEEQYAFYGEVSSTDLISGYNLALKIGLSSGSSRNNHAGWLKFLYKGKILFVAKKKLRENLSWDDINSVGAAYGEKIVEIKGLNYKVRLLRGIGEDVQPDPSIHQEKYAGDACYYSEWNTLLCPISEEAPSLWQYPDNVQEPISKLRKTYTNIELDMSGSSWCQEACRTGRSYRGGKGVSHANATSSSSATEGWRPVLELVE